MTFERQKQNRYADCLDLRERLFFDTSQFPLTPGRNITIIYNKGISNFTISLYSLYHTAKQTDYLFSYFQKSICRHNDVETKTSPVSQGLSLVFPLLIDK